MDHPTASCPKYPRTWMQPFLDSFTASGHLEQAAVQLHVSPQNVRFQVEHHPKFAAAFAAAQAKIADRLWCEHCQRARDAGLLDPVVLPIAAEPAPPTSAAAPAFGKHTTILLCADMESLVRLVARVAEQAGVSELGGMSILDWFNAQRHIQLDRFIRSIRCEFSAYADDVAQELGSLQDRGHDVPEAPYPPEG